MSMRAGPIFSAKGGINPFPQRKDSHSFFPVDIALSIPVTFFKESMSQVMQIYLIAPKNIRHTAGIELWSPL